MADPPWQLEIEEAARRELRRIPLRTRARVFQAFERLANDPYEGDVKKIAGHTHTWRVRVGDYRVVFVIDQPEQTVTVVRVAHRSNVYR